MRVLVFIELVLAAGLGILVWQSLGHFGDREANRGEQTVDAKSGDIPSKATILAGLENGIELPLANVAPMTELRETLERPLFQPGRRPPPPPQPEAKPETPVAEVEPPPPPEPPEFTLEAVVLAGDMRAALLGIGDGSTRRVGEGGAIEGWVLASIEPHRVTLQKGSVEHPLELRRFESAPPSPARRAARRTPRAAPAKPGARRGRDARVQQRQNRANAPAPRNSAARRAARAAARDNARSTSRPRSRTATR